MTRDLGDAIAEYAAALEEKDAAKNAETKSRIRSQKAHHRWVLARRELRALELEAQEPIYAHS